MFAENITSTRVKDGWRILSVLQQKPFFSSPYRVKGLPLGLVSRKKTSLGIPVTSVFLTIRLVNEQLDGQEYGGHWDT